MGADRLTGSLRLEELLGALPLFIDVQDKVGGVRTIRLGDAVIRIDHVAHWMETVYEDGTRAPAAPQDTDEYRATAARLGYGTDTWRQCVEHEVLHTWVALKMGRPHSTILWNVAHGGAKRWPPGGREEEAHAMGLQRFLNTGEIDEPTQELFVMCARLWRQTATDVTHQARLLLGEVAERGENATLAAGKEVATLPADV